MRIFIAGASGLIGIRLVPLLVDAGHLVAGMTRSPEKAGMLNELGAQPVVCDLAQSISWEHRTEAGRAAAAAHEGAVLNAGGVVVRYGQLWGPGTYYETAPPDAPRIHVDEAARQTLPALDAPPGLTLVIDDRATSLPR